jgi:hypothetical protein
MITNAGEEDRKLKNRGLGWRPPFLSRLFQFVEGLPIEFEIYVIR